MVETSLPKLPLYECHWWSIHICSGNGLVPSGNKPLLQPRLTQFSVTMWRHWPQWVKAALLNVCFTYYIPSKNHVSLHAIHYPWPNLLGAYMHHQWVSERVIKFNGLSGTLGYEVHVIYISCVIITYTFGSVSSLYQ